MRPNRVVIGASSEHAIAIMRDLYRPLFLIETPFLITDVETAELVKYASNAFLATKISFINEIAQLCERLGVDVNVVAKGMGLDSRIGSKFLHAGAGFGGSCFPKDSLALIQMGAANGIRLELLESVIRVNHGQRARILEKVTRLVGGLRVSKSSLRVETYGSVDELNSFLGFARSICEDAEIKQLTQAIQKELFVLGADLATPGEAKENQARVSQGMVDRLTNEVHRIEAMEGILSDWSIPGEDSVSAAYDMARTACRRAERFAVRLAESGEIVSPAAIVYLNRLSDLVWLLGRWIELKKGANSALRDDEHGGPRWSRAW
jgi:cob(I)alamin adenosyltransferase